MSNAPSAQDPLPPNYQERDAEYVYRFLFSGESCSLVGIGSVGKSNLMQFLASYEAREKYLGKAVAPFFIPVLLDPHKMVHLQKRALEQAGTAWPGYEIMLNRLRRALAELDDRGLLPPMPPDQPDLIARVEEQYLNLFSDQPLLAQSGIRHLEEAVFEVMRLDARYKITFMFDEFEGFYTLPPEFFETLRGVRDEFKNRIMFVTTSRRPLEEAVDGWYDRRGFETMEGFFDLFRGFTRYISLLDRDSADILVRRLEKRYDLAIEPANRRNLMDATGRHAGLMRRSFLPIQRLATVSLTLDQICDYLLQSRGVVGECAIILESLSPAEHRCLWYAAQGQFEAVDERAWNKLKDKHLVDYSQQGAPSLTLPLLRRYLLGQPEPT